MHGALSIPAIIRHPQRRRVGVRRGGEGKGVIVESTLFCATPFKLRDEARWVGR